MSLIYLYTNEDGDDGRHEVKPGVYGRPVFQSKVKSFLSKGWSRNANEVEPKTKAKKATRTKAETQKQEQLPVDPAGDDNADQE